jgi:FixJ family two-component response regulator
MDMIVAGGHNRDIAEKLGISPRTVEVHKARVMQKLNVDGIAQLVRLSLGAGDGLAADQDNAPTGAS